MKSRHLLVLVGLLIPGWLWAGETNLVLTIDGVTYSNVTWGAATPATVKMYHAAGVATVDLEKLPADLQARFDYDAAKAAAYRAANVPPPAPPVKMLDRTETGNALARVVHENYGLGFGFEVVADQVEVIRGRYKQLLELQKTGHPDYRAAVEQFIEACKRAIDRHYEAKKGPPPKVPDRMGGNDLANNIARQNLAAAKEAADAYNNRLARLKDEANGNWAEGQRLKRLADDKGRPVPQVKPKPAPTDPYLEEVP